MVLIENQTRSTRMFTTINQPTAATDTSDRLRRQAATHRLFRGNTRRRARRHQRSAETTIT
jgi:hypothetical protein